VQTVDQEYSSVDRFFPNSLSISRMAAFTSRPAKALAAFATLPVCFPEFWNICCYNKCNHCILCHTIFCYIQTLPNVRKKGHTGARTVLHCGCLMMTSTAWQPFQHKKFASFDDLLWRLPFFNDPPPHC